MHHSNHTIFLIFYDLYTVQLYCWNIAKPISIAAKASKSRHLQTHKTTGGIQKESELKAYWERASVDYEVPVSPSPLWGEDAGGLIGGVAASLPVT